MKFEKVTVVIVATDEEKSLIQTVDTIALNCDMTDIDSILIVIPENASEGCIHTIEYLKEKYYPVVRRHNQQLPYIGGAVREAIKLTDSSHIMFLSADIPTDLRSVPEMIEKAKEHPEKIIKISRWLEKNSFYGYSEIRKVFNRIAQLFLRILYNSKLTDFTIPVLIGPTSVYKKADFKEWKFPFFLEMVLLPLSMKCTIIEIPTKCYARKEGKSSNSFMQTADYLRVALHIRFMKKEDILLDKKD